MGTLKIGSAKEQKGVTIDPRTVLFNDNNVKYLKNDAIEIWSYIKALVPKLNSNNGNNGEVIYSDCYDDSHSGYKAFDDDDSTRWVMLGQTTTSTGYIGYKFKTPSIVNKVVFNSNPNISDNRIKKFKIQASNGDNNWVDLTNEITIENKATDTIVEFENNNAYLCYVVKISESYLWGAGMTSLQFYGIQLKALIPTMTSNTTPSGEASANGITRSELKGKQISQAYTIFAGVSDNGSSRTYFNLDENVANRYVQYKFDKPKVVRLIYLENNVDGSKYYVSSFKIQASKDGVIFNDISTTIEHSGGNSFGQYHQLENNTPYIAYRLIPLSHVHPANENEMNLGARLQFFG